MTDRAHRHGRRGPGAAAQRRAALERAGHVLTVVAILHGLVVLGIGWAGGVAVARGQFAGMPPIPPLTAAAFVAAGTALLVLGVGVRGWARVAARLLAALVALLGAVVLLEYLTGVDMGTSGLLLPADLAAAAGGRPGMLAPNSAVCFLLFGSALIALRPPGQRTPVLEWLTLPVAFIALQALIGYAYGAEPLYRLSALAPIPLPTAAGLLLLSCALLCMRPEQGLVSQLAADDAGGFVARRLLLLSVALPLFIGWVGLQGLRHGLYDIEVGTALIVAGAIFGVSGAVWTSTRALSRADRRRRSAAAALRAGAGRLRRAVEMSPFPQMIHAEDGRVLQISRAWTELTGYAAPEIRTIEAWVERAYGDAAPAALERIRRLYALEQRTDLGGEQPIRTRDGDTRIWLFSSAPLGRLHNGRRLVISAAADVTERTRAEQEVRRTNRRLMFLFDATSRLLASRDPHQLIQTLYREVAELLGLDVYFHYVITEDRGRLVLELSSFDGLSAADTRALRRLELGQPVCGMAAATGRRVVSETGGRSQVRMPAPLRELGVRAYVCHPLTARDQVVGTLAFGTRARDRFTGDELGMLQAVADQVALAVDRAQAEDRERSARLGAEQASRAKDQFLAVVSHELRTPLTAVVGYTDLLQADVAGELTAAQRRFVERIRESAWSLASVIDEILTFVRTQARQEEVRPEPTDAVRVVREVIGTLQPEAMRKGLALKTRLPEHSRMIHSDGAKLRRIVTNLLGNAVKFTDQGEVRVDLAFSHSALRIDVTDTGPGIPPEFHERIFDPFIQVDASETRTKNGTGLGLTITRELTRLLGGEVSVASEPGRGSTFTVELPVAAAVHGGDGAHLSRGPGAGS